MSRTVLKSSSVTLAGHILPAGTCVLSADGALPVEYLCPGDRLITRDGGLTPLLTLEASLMALPCVQICASALGAAFPDRPLIVPAAQKVLVRGPKAKEIWGQPSYTLSAANLAKAGLAKDIGIQQKQMVGLILGARRTIYAEGVELPASH